MTIPLNKLVCWNYFRHLGPACFRCWKFEGKKKVTSDSEVVYYKHFHLWSLLMHCESTSIAYYLSLAFVSGSLFCCYSEEWRWSRWEESLVYSPELLRSLNHNNKKILLSVSVCLCFARLPPGFFLFLFV